jgi:hypothetical protein
MFSRTKRNVGFMAWSAVAVVTLGVAAGASAVVPQLINAEDAPSAVASAQVDVAVDGPVEAAAAAAPSPEAEQAVAVVEEVVAEEETVAATTTPRKVAAAKVVEAPAAVVAAPAPPPPPPPPPVPVLAARTVPSAGQVQAVITGIKGLIPMLALVTVSPAQVADIGNQVCTAFDQGQSLAQVKAAGLAQVPAFVTVSPAAATYVVNNAVALYCPAYASKL